MKHLANAITLARIVLTPVMLVALFGVTLQWKMAALVLFVVLAISDWVDGRLARSFEAHSRLGQFLDPLADKILVLGTFIGLAVLLPESVPWSAVALIGLRDVAVTAYRSWAEARGRTVKTLYAAKVKTTVQLTYLIGMLVLLVAVLLPDPTGQAAAWLLASWWPLALCWVTVLATLYTGVLYAFATEPVPTAKAKAEQMEG